MSSTEESESGSERSKSTDVELQLKDLVEKPPGDFALNVHIHCLRVIVGRLCVGILLQFRGEGYEVHSLLSIDREAQDQKKMLDGYNEKLASLTAFKPLDIFLSVEVAIAFLCLASKWGISDENRRRYPLMTAVGAIGYLINTGFNSLNLQVIPAQVHPMIGSCDLIVEVELEDTQHLDGNGFLSTTWNTSYRESAPEHHLPQSVYPSRSRPDE